MSAKRVGSPLSLELAILVAALASAPMAFGQTTYKCQDGGNTVYSDRPCLAGVEVKRMAPNGGPTREDLARARMKARADEMRGSAEKQAEKRSAAATATSATATVGALTKAPKAPAAAASRTQ